MTLFQKISKIQYELLAHKFTKSGHNKFNKFKYFELEDILPIIVQKCYENEVLLSFNFTETEATLILREFSGDNIFETSIPMPEITPINKGTSLIQSLGGYNTYLKRYLLLNTFMICEDELIDSTPSKEFTTADKIKKIDKDPVAENLAKSLCAAVTKQGKPCRKGVLIACARTCEKLTSEEKNRVIQYLKTLPNGEIKFDD